MGGWVGKLPSYLLGVLDGVLDEFLELALDALQPPNVVPVDVGHLFGWVGGWVDRREGGELTELIGG